MSTHKAFNCVLAGALVFFAGTNLWAVPAGFNVQGRLTDANGVNRSGESFWIKFSIYDSFSSGTGNLFWSKILHPVGVKNGNFQVVLTDPGEDGRFKSLKDVFTSDNAFLEIQVIAGPGISQQEKPMLPRQKLVSVPFAFTSQKVQENPVPRGVIVMWSGSVEELPPGWCLCDGRTCTASNGDQVVTPNLSDRFILGTNSANEMGKTGGSDNPIINPPGAWSSQLSGWSFYNQPGLTKDASKVRWHYVDIPPFQMGVENFYPKYFKLAFIMKL